MPRHRPAGTPQCHCGRPAPFEDCCAPLLRGERRAATAEDLMRSRYSAFMVGDADYLLNTWHPDTRPPRLSLDAEQRWLGLKIKATTAGGASHEHGTVEFVARYKISGQGCRLHENSRFARVDGEWRYLDGDFPSADN